MHISLVGDFVYLFARPFFFMRALIYAITCDTLHYEYV